MIPEFPEFKRLEISDKKEVEKFTSKFPPYSDFNFVSMWSWDVNGEMRISQCHGNLIVRFTDYLTGKPFYSFLGNHNVNETAEALLELSKKEGLELILKLIPEEATKKIDNSKFLVTEDKSHFDYILPIEVLENFNSLNSLVQRKKRAVNSLRKAHSPSVALLDLSDKNNVNKIFEFIKQSLPDEKVIERELIAIRRFVEGYKDPNYLIMAAFIKSKLVGFCFTEILKNNFANFHFWKADTKNYKPMYSFLLQEKARLLSTKHDVKFLNIEQDLGVENLRKWKSSFGSSIFLKKYTVAPVK